MGRDERMAVTGNRVKVLDDGRVEITLLIPLPLFRYKRWVKFYAHGSELIIEGDKITGIRCHPKLWEETLKTLAPELLEHFRKIVKEGIRKFGEKSKGPHRIFQLPLIF
jgi:hypothetical protein